MQNFDVKRNSRKCSACDRDLRPGDTFYSALVEHDGNMERVDFCAESWESPPEDCIGWWKTKMPEVGPGKVYWAPREVLISYFRYVMDQPDKTDTAYVTALLLMQKKILTIEELPLENDADHLYLVNRKDNLEFKVPVIDIDPVRLRQIQLELEEKLFLDQPCIAEHEQDNEVASSDADP